MNPATAGKWASVAEVRVLDGCGTTLQALQPGKDEAILDVAGYGGMVFVEIVLVSGEREVRAVPVLR